MDFALFTDGGLNFFFRWLHLLGGITWIGILYYFNFIQGSWFKETDANTKGTAMSRNPEMKMVPHGAIQSSMNPPHPFAAASEPSVQNIGQSREDERPPYYLTAGPIVPPRQYQQDGHDTHPHDCDRVG